MDLVFISMSTLGDTQGANCPPCGYAWLAFLGWGILRLVELL